MRGEVLGFVHNTEGFGEAAPADEGKGFDNELFALLHLFEAFHFGGGGGKLAFDDVEVVKQGLHVGGHFFFGIAGKEADVFVGQGHDGTCQQDLLVFVHLCQGGGQGEQGFTGACLAGEGHEFHRRVVQHFECEALLGVAGFDAVALALEHAVDGMGEGVVACQHAVARTAEHKAFVGVQLVFVGKLIDVDAFV